MKTCSKCQQTKPVQDFFINISAAGTRYRHGVCQECRRAQNRAQSKTSRGKQVKRDGILRRQFGMSRADYDAMAERQKGVCAICLRPETKTYRNGKVPNLSVDHDHMSGHVRALLCQKCNVGLGSFCDDHERLIAAANYLESFKP